MNTLSGIVAFTVLAGLLILQTTIFSQLPLLYGTPDLVLIAVIAWATQKRVQTAWLWGMIGGLLVGYVSNVPMLVYLFAYLAATGFALALRQQMWNVPLLAMLLSVFLGTLILHGLTILALRIVETPLSLGSSLNLIVLPSLLLNIILAFPFYLLFGDLANLLHPQPMES